MTAKQASEAMGVSVSMIYQLCAENRLPHFRVGATGRRGKVIIEPEGIQRFLESCRVEKPKATSWIK